MRQVSTINDTNATTFPGPGNSTARFCLDEPSTLRIELAGMGVLVQPGRGHAVNVIELLLFVGGVALIVWGAERFAEHLAAASARLGVGTFALAVLLAGAEPEELATAVTAGLRGAPAIAFGDVIGANAAVCLVALAVGAWIAPLPLSGAVR